MNLPYVAAKMEIQDSKGRKAVEQSRVQLSSFPFDSYVSIQHRV